MFTVAIIMANKMLIVLSSVEFSSIALQYYLTNSFMAKVFFIQQIDLQQGHDGVQHPTAAP
jgi:hypothetical protein